MSAPEQKVAQEIKDLQDLHLNTELVLGDMFLKRNPGTIVSRIKGFAPKIEEFQKKHLDAIKSFGKSDLEWVQHLAQGILRHAELTVEGADKHGFPDAKAPATKLVTAAEGLYNQVKDLKPRAGMTA